MSLLTRAPLRIAASTSSTLVRKPLLKRRYSLAATARPRATHGEAQPAQRQSRDLSWDFSKIAVSRSSPAVAHDSFAHRASPAALARQGGTDGRSEDGEDNYPRQSGDEARAPSQGTAASAPAQAGTYPNPPTVPEILADTVMAAQLQRAWVESNPNAAAVPRGSPGSLKREQGGWFQWRKDSHILQSRRVPAGTRDGLATIVGTRPPDSDILAPVAWYHTHPNTAAEGYTHTASAGDIAWQNAEAKVPGIIMTHNGVVTIPYP